MIQRIHYFDNGKNEGRIKRINLLRRGSADLSTRLIGLAQRYSNFIDSLSHDGFKGIRGLFKYL